MSGERRQRTDACLGGVLVLRLGVARKRLRGEPRRPEGAWPSRFLDPTSVPVCRSMKSAAGRLEGVASMDALCAICCCLAALVGLSAGYGLARFYDRSRLQSAQARVADITAQAQRE